MYVDAPRPGRPPSRPRHAHAAWNDSICLIATHIHSGVLVHLLQPAGIWRDIYIQFFDEITLDAVTIIPTTTDNSHWTADVVVYVNSGGAVQDGTLEVSVAGTKASVPVTLKKGEQKVSLHLTGIQADPWWPNGYGKQPMYELKATYTASTGATTELKRMTGFRTVQITQRPLGGEGYTMEFTVNGKAIFMKGMRHSYAGRCLSLYRVLCPFC